MANDIFTGLNEGIVQQEGASIAPPWKQVEIYGIVGMYAWYDDNTCTCTRCTYNRLTSLNESFRGHTDHMIKNHKILPM